MSKLSAIDIPYLPPFEETSLKNLTNVKDYIKVVLKFWRDKFEAGRLTAADFEDFWNLWVPNMYSLAVERNHLNWNFDDILAQDLLFNILDDFIFNGDSAMVLKELATVRSGCCKFFQQGEPIYSCRDCAISKTCFLCVDCFKNSEHGYHKYRMSTSGGTGCCDCGNAEMWKKNSVCKAHISDTTKDEQHNKLSEDLIERTKIVFGAVLCYACQLLSVKQNANIKVHNLSEDLFGVDSFCVLLYFDKNHAFDEVIETLTKVVRCNKTSCIEYVTNMVREGRAVIKCSTFQHSSELKSKIEKYSSADGKKPMNVLVNHTHILAHQIYARRLLSWLVKYVEQGREFRKVFADAILKTPNEEACICENLLLKDCFLWKGVRSEWHRLLKSGIFREYDNKKAFAKMFAKNYGRIMRSFIQDDQDHICSVSAYSIQLFTVPSIAHHLIAHDDILYILLDTLVTECTRKCNAAGKLDFDRNPVTQNFKRALSVLNDLNYLISTIPEKWTENLRQGFLRGFSLLLQVFTIMQGMDAVIRQEGQHIEYEPNYKSGFKLQFMLSDSIFLATKWCGSDKVILVKAYQSVLKKLEEIEYYKVQKAEEVRKSVSVHLPLTRFLAALHLSLEKYNLDFNSPEFQIINLGPVEILDSVLSVQVMKAQVHSGMWKRNGNSLLNTLFLYHNVDYRHEMLNRDITLIQICASLMESNKFLIHLLNKFNFLNWAMFSFEKTNLKSSEDDNIQHNMKMVEEFLHLLIIIIGERYMQGVSNVTIKGRIRKEIIQSLCIRPLPHSELIRTISYDLISQEDTVDEVIQEVTILKRPTHLDGKSVLELQKQYYNEFNVFFYQYTLEEQSKAEASIRTRRKTEREIECCPPPKLPKLTEPFTILVNLLQCDVMLRIMQTVLKRCTNLKNGTYSEAELHKVLHLIGYALLEEESKNYPFFKFTEKATTFKLFSLIEELAKSSRIDFHEGLLKWTLNKYKQVVNKKDGHCAFLKKTFCLEELINEKEKTAKLAAERKAKLMEQMQRMQNNFIKENPNLFVQTSGNPQTSSKVVTLNLKETSVEQPVALGPNHTTPLTKERTCICIICQEEEKITSEAPSMVMAAFVQKASILCQQRKKKVLTQISKCELPYLHANLGPAPHTSSCGHVMHSKCWRKYFDGIKVQKNRRLGHPNVEKQEFLCPLCQRLSNAVLPLTPSLTSLRSNVPENDLTFDQWMGNIHTILSKAIKICRGGFKYNSSDKRKPASIEQHINKHVCAVSCKQQTYSYKVPSDLPQKFVELFPTKSVALNVSHKEAVHAFAQTVCTMNLQIDPLSSDKKLCPTNWNSLAYTIHSIEVLVRDSKKPLLGQLSSGQQECIESFIRLVSILGSSLSSTVFVRNQAMSLLSILFKHDNESPSILQWDSFGFLISLTFSLPSVLNKDIPVPIPTGGTLDSYLLRIIFTCHIVKILILLKYDFDLSKDANDKYDGKLLEILKIIGKETENVNTHNLWKHVQNACVPFLRCCVLFYHYLTETPAPVTLTEVGGDTFESMCSYLGLPQNPDELFSSIEIKQSIKLWSNHENVLRYLDGANMAVIYEPQQIPTLIELPTDYSELINNVSTFTCSTCLVRDPYICLICGETFCTCENSYHTAKCGADVSIFLQVRYCQILFLAAQDEGCFVPAPYLDDYGETDEGLIRGNRLTLCPKRYEKLRTLWLSHSLREEIAKSDHVITMQ